MGSYLVLAALAVALNINERRMLYLALVVSLGVFMPVPDANFYLVCGLGEVLICLAALRLNARASAFVCQLSVTLVMLHFEGYILDGYPPDSPYHLLVRICEHAELVICILCSRPIFGGHDHAS